jgi:hypothetical protein
VGLREGVGLGMRKGGARGELGLRWEETGLCKAAVEGEAVTGAEVGGRAMAAAGAEAAADGVGVAQVEVRRAQMADGLPLPRGGGGTVNADTGLGAAAAGRGADGGGSDEGEGEESEEDEEGDGNEALVGEYEGAGGEAVESSGEDGLPFVSSTPTSASLTTCFSRSMPAVWEQ